MSHSNSQEVYQLYDKIFKKILTLSSTAVINLINGLFETDHPTDSVITDSAFPGAQGHPALRRLKCPGRVHTQP